MNDETRNIKDAMFKYWANHPCGIGIAEANAEWHIKQAATLRTQLAEAKAACAVKDEVIRTVYESLCAMQISHPHFVNFDRLDALVAALSPTAGQSLLEEVKGLREALESIRDATNPDDEKSYRSDDREGCLDWVFGHAQKALKKGRE